MLPEQHHWPSCLLPAVQGQLHTGLLLGSTPNRWQQIYPAEPGQCLASAQGFPLVQIDKIGKKYKHIIEIYIYSLNYWDKHLAELEEKADFKVVSYSAEGWKSSFRYLWVKILIDIPGYLRNEISGNINHRGLFLAEHLNPISVQTQTCDWAELPLSFLESHFNKTSSLSLRRFHFNMLADLKKRFHFIYWLPGNIFPGKILIWLHKRWLNTTGNGVHSSDCPRRALTDS